MQTLNLDLGNRSYPIYIGKGLLGIEKILCQHIEGKNVAIVSNETIANHYQEILCKSLGEYEILSITLLDGEKQKNLYLRWGNSQYVSNQQIKRNNRE